MRRFELSCPKIQWLYQKQGVRIPVIARFCHCKGIWEKALCTVSIAEKLLPAMDRHLKSGFTKILTQLLSLRLPSKENYRSSGPMLVSRKVAFKLVCHHLGVKKLVWFVHTTHLCLYSMSKVVLTHEFKQ